MKRVVVALSMVVVFLMATTFCVFGVPAVVQHNELTSSWVGTLAYYQGFTFVADNDHNITGIGLEFCKVGVAPFSISGDLTIKLENVNQGTHVTESPYTALATATISKTVMENIPVYPETQWLWTALNTSVSLEDGVEYGVILHLPGDDAIKYFYDMHLESEQAYDGGKLTSTNDSSEGATTYDDTYNINFRLYGEVDDPSGGFQIEALQAKNIQYTTADVGAVIRDMGVFEDMDISIEYGTDLEYSNGQPLDDDVNYINSEMWHTLSGLTENTKYYYRAKADNGVNTVYSTTKEFTTLNADQPPILARITGWFGSNGMGSTGWWLVLILVNGILWWKFHEHRIVCALFSVLSVGAMIAFNLLDVWILVLLGIVVVFVGFKLIFRKA